MPSESSSCDHHRRTTTTTKTAGAPPPEPEHLPCPRCNSTNTKFCYYNNYNFSQPRHFCKACRRYWTHGGTLRDIPIGGGSRKNAKRCRLANTNTNTNTSTLEFRHMLGPPTGTPMLLPGVNMALGESFTSLLNCGFGPNGPGGPNVHNGLSGTNGLGFLGVGGFEDVGFGFGRGLWGFNNGVGDIGGYAAVNGGGGNMWQLGSGESGHGGECLSLPDLAI